MSPEDITEAMSVFPDAQPPSKLYRFYPPTAVAALRDGTLRITPPDQFNDPFELSPGVRKSDLSEESVRQNFVAENGLCRQVFAKRFENEEKYRRWIDEVVVGRADLWPKHLETLRDAVTHTACQMFGIACFSAFSEVVLNGPLGIRHWSIYADDHKGFAIEYDSGAPLFVNWAASKWLFPVVYQVDRPAVSLADFDDFVEMKALQTLRRWAEVKCLDAWGDELEWRLICPLSIDGPGSSRLSTVEHGSDRMHLFHLWSEDLASRGRDIELIKRVVLGVRASDALEREIREALAAARLDHVALVRSVVSDRSFSLRLREPLSNRQGAHCLTP